MVLWGLYGGSVAVKGKVSKLTYDFPLARSRALCGGVHSRLTRDAVGTIRGRKLAIGHTHPRHFFLERT